MSSPVQRGQALGNRVPNGSPQLHSEWSRPDGMTSLQDPAGRLDVLHVALGPTADLDECRPLCPEEPAGHETEHWEWWGPLSVRHGDEWRLVQQLPYGRQLPSFQLYVRIEE